MTRVCLIVDNPLRDLDGLVLLAWQIARAGGEAYLVPMYTQGFDVPAIAPDAVVTNYVRHNNADLLKLYREQGAVVAVLDTEGAIGKTADDNARLIRAMRCGDYVDFYCFWGEVQRDAFRRHEALPPSALRLTGCPRYDFCAPAWRGALGSTGFAERFILINTNFPIVNPRYSSGTDAELEVWIQAGNDPVWARQFAADSRIAQRTVVEVMRRIATRFPSERFVLRPHPFERIAAYAALEDLPNLQIRQVGTSLQWINEAATVLHQNCSTAIEAMMLGKEPISLEWFNTEALNMPTPTLVSHHAANAEGLEAYLEAVFERRGPRADAALTAARERVIREQYFRIDGQASARVAAMLFEAVVARRRTPRRLGRSLRARAVHGARRALGYSTFERVRRMRSNPAIEARRAAKYVSCEQVEEVLGRIARASGSPRLRAEAMPRASGRSIRINHSNSEGPS